jgi:2-oxoadipate dioxygenase/decarboxylase
VTTAELLDVLWRGYVASAPQVVRIHELLTQRGEILAHDHIAFGTYGVPGIGIDMLARPFEALGWRPREGYRSRGHLRARYWQHDDAALPKLFISELVLDELSPDAQAVIERLVGQLPAGFGARGDVAWAGRAWCVAYAEYLALAAESELAAWIAAFGFRVHHFTVDVDSLSTFPDLEALDAFLIEHGFTLDDRGGTIKGSRADRIEQSSTRADTAVVAFADRAARIPSCRYEFARRYRLPSGEVFHGFVPASADQLRELRASTDVGIAG